MVNLTLEQNVLFYCIIKHKFYYYYNPMLNYCTQCYKQPKGFYYRHIT